MIAQRICIDRFPAARCRCCGPPRTRHGGQARGALVSSPQWPLFGAPISVSSCRAAPARGRWAQPETRRRWPVRSGPAPRVFGLGAHRGPPLGPRQQGRRAGPAVGAGGTRRQQPSGKENTGLRSRQQAGDPRPNPQPMDNVLGCHSSTRGRLRAGTAEEGRRGRLAVLDTEVGSSVMG